MKKLLMDEIAMSERINRSLSRLCRVLISEHYVLDFHKDDGNYYVDIVTGTNSNTYVCYDRAENTVTFSHTPDAAVEHETFTYEVSVENLFTTDLLNVIRKHIVPHVD